ncbi:hypothetical protein Vadar_009010 [Vaccinium darrowii]|uniref:Uncharacterized protein n=1 Tax=Vaccinium darrowii TaxID=229202 RepID=A0ACB7X932_9ERIC|nr:hypothetical protein Vadar_009010 [Vaccinium darrowii]
MDETMVIALLQLAPETFDLFNDVILLSEGQVVYQGPRENVQEFFEYMGFKCPDRKGIADFLQEAFNTFHVRLRVCEDLRIPYDKSKVDPAALVTESYGISNLELFRACFSREWLLMKRDSFVYLFKATQLIITTIIALSVFLRMEMKYGELEDASRF